MSWWKRIVLLLLVLTMPLYMCTCRDINDYPEDELEMIDWR